MSSHLTALAQLERLGFPDLLLWLLTFAVVYGVLSQAKVPKSAASRAIIAIVSGLFVLMAAPASLISVISKMSTNLIVLILGLLTLIVFLEAAGVHVGKNILKFGKDEKGNPKSEQVSRQGKLFEKHPMEFAIILIVLAGLVFVGSGGLKLLGGNISFSEVNIVSVGFLVAVVLAVLVLYLEKGDD